MAKYNSGTYRVYHMTHGSGDPQEVMIGRFMISHNNFNILEDHDGLLGRELPEGAMDDHHQKCLFELDNSPYFKLIPEQQINQGLHNDLIEEVDWADTNPEARYMLIAPNEEPKRMEMYGETVVLDGEKLSDEAVKKIVGAVREGKFKLVPV
jgi:hypothetical protein